MIDDFGGIPPGEMVMGYRITKKLKSTPIRHTYEAEHPTLDRRVAIKFCASQDFQESFLIAARLMGRLDHPNIATLYDAGEIRGVPFIVTEFIEGFHLGELADGDSGLDLTALLRIMQEISSALSHSHQKRVVHRNIKPQNIIVTREGKALLSDFEIAIPLDNDSYARLVTPPYMSPEQASHEVLTAQTDIWSIGASLYWALTGRKVVDTRSDVEIEGHKAKDTAYTEPSHDDCYKFLLSTTPVSYGCLTGIAPDYVISILKKCLDKEISRRWPTAAHLSSAFESALARQDADSTSTTVAYSLPSVGQSIVVYAETHRDTVSGDFRHFTLNEFLGDGRFGLVFRARETFTEKEVALKFLKPQRVHDGDSLRRFQREARLMSKISHPNVVTVFSQGRYGPVLFIAMQLLEKRDLASHLLNRCPLSVRESVGYIEGIVSGLSALHEAGIIHRDLKPENVGFSDGHPVIADFGVATGKEVTKLTASGAIIGTVQYMSPEQAAGEIASFASDMYSVGVILYEMLTGRFPHEASTVMELMYKVQQDPICDISELRDDLSVLLRELISNLLAKDPDERPSAIDSLRILSGI